MVIRFRIYVTHISNNTSIRNTICWNSMFNTIVFHFFWGSKITITSKCSLMSHIFKNIMILNIIFIYIMAIRCHNKSMFGTICYFNNSVINKKLFIKVMRLNFKKYFFKYIIELIKYFKCFVILTI